MLDVKISVLWCLLTASLVLVENTVKTEEIPGTTVNFDTPGGALILQLSRAKDEKDLSRLFSGSFRYNNHSYYLGTIYSSYLSIDIYQITCHMIGGYIVEINDWNEHAAILDYMTSAQTPSLVIAGTDVVDGVTWLLPTGEPNPVLNWRGGQPSNNAYEDCLMIDSSDQLMYDHSCYPGSVDYTLRNLCEVPDLLL